MCEYGTRKCKEVGPSIISFALHDSFRSRSLGYENNEMRKIVT